MGQLKDLLVSGPSRFIGKLFANEAQLTTLNIPTTSGGTTYGPGTNNQILTSNGTTVYWANGFSGNASTADKLKTARKINGTNFDGSADITTANWGTARTLTIGNKGQSVNGSANVLWALQDVLIRAGNEFNYTADGVSSLWFNYKTQTGTSAATAITNYHFGNGQGAITGVTVNAATFKGNLTGNVTGNVTGNADTATKFASNHSVTLTGDTTGTASSQAGWSITTKTDRVSTVGDNRGVATNPNDYSNKIIFQGLKTNSSFGSPSTDSYSYVIGLRGWSDSSGGNAHELAFNDSGIFRRQGATTSWSSWVKMIDSGNYTNYTVTKTGSGASGTWNISISGNAATATSATKAVQDGSGNNIANTYLKKSGGDMTGTLKLKGLKGTASTDYGEILPASPTEGQIFFQLSSEQYELPVGGSTGTLLMKNSLNDRDVKWTPASIYVGGTVLYGAAWNDYAEFRSTTGKVEPGRVVIENGDDTLSLSTERLQSGAEIVSDTFGFAIGQTEKCNTPIAASGRVLAYPYESRDTYKPGQPVCSGPKGTISQMTDEEARQYPWLIIGTVSSIPDYEYWGEENIKVNGRIWIRIR